MTRYSGWSTAKAAKTAEKTFLPKANKYGAKRVQVDGIWFDSKAEAKRYTELKLMQTAGMIQGLIPHPTYKIKYLHEFICKVELDFSYLENKRSIMHYEDVKSPATNTPLSKLKRKLVEAFYGIKVEVIGL